MDGENDPHQPEEFLMGMIRGEHLYVLKKVPTEKVPE
jgi:hypothetical protein